MWNNASFTSTFGLPTSNSVQFNPNPYRLSPNSVEITSLAADPNKRRLYFSALRGIYTINNYSIWQNDSMTIASVVRGKSQSVGQIALDHLSNNIYWCDGHLNWIAMKPLEINDSNPDSTYKVIIDEDLHQPEGLALDPWDG